MNQDIKCVIIIDEDDDDVRFLSQAITDQHPNCKIIRIQPDAENIKTLAELQEVAELIFLDCYANNRIGLECLKAVRSIEHLLSTRIILTCSTRFLIEDAKAHGASHYLLKPDNYTSYEGIVVKISKMLESGRKAAEDFLIE